MPLRDSEAMTDTSWAGLLIDIDGVLHVGSEPIDGARDALDMLRQRELPFRLVTNTTSRSRRRIIERLANMGFAVQDSDVLTPAALALDVCHDRGYERVGLHVAAALKEDLSPLQHSDADDVQAVIIGDLGEEFTYPRLNAIFGQLQGGAELIALQRNRVWQSEHGLVLDAGPFVVALEYAIGREALVTGKPSPAFFDVALAQLGIRPEQSAMIGDDLEADVGGAIEAGMTGILVRTGKFRPEVLHESDVSPTLVWDSIAELADELRS